MRLDVWLAQQGLPFSRSQIHRRIEEGEVRVDGNASKPGLKLKPKQQIRFVPAPLRNTLDQPETIPLDILYEDKHLIVINKPAGLVVHPAPGHETGTLVNALLAHCGVLPYPSYSSTEENNDEEEPSLAIGGEHRPGIVHRLDQGTSGILVCAKEEFSLRELQLQFQAHTIKREYIALAQGVLAAEGSFRTRHGRHPRDRKKFTGLRGNKHAITHYRTLERFPGATLVWVQLETGRTHQIRVHFSESGHALLGDPLYGSSPKNNPVLAGIHSTLGHQALHAQCLGFVHPVTKNWLEFRTPPPSDFADVLQRLRSG